jgi:hypothetical protein
MRETLEALKATIEKALKVDIDKVSRKREFTYARAIFCKIAREVPINGKTATYSEIGRIINKNHATVLHLEKNTFHYAVQGSDYLFIYRAIREVYSNVVNEGADDLSSLIDSSISEIDLLKKQNEKLKKQIMIQGVIEERVSNLLSTLDDRDLEVVINKIEVMVKAAKNVRERFNECAVFHYE